MSFRELISAMPAGRWAIPLATHAKTLVPNETSEPVLKLAGPRSKREEKYRSMYAAIRDPIAGYNCFGHVFASRRTAIYEPAFVRIFLDQDGYCEIANVEEVRPGDVVIYEDESGANHAARVVRIDQSLLLDASASPAPSRTPSVVVLSKFDDVSGEYEHNLDDVRWSPFPLERKFYRERGQPPLYPPRWRDAVLDLEAET